MLNNGIETYTMLEAGSKMIQYRAGMKLTRLIVITLAALFFLSACTNPKPPAPWEGKQVFIDETKTINVDVGEEFIISYECYHDAFPLFDIIYVPDDIVTLLDEKGGNAGDSIGHTIGWFLFKALKVGETDLTITETNHQETKPSSQKTFRINVVQQ